MSTISKGADFWRKITALSLFRCMHSKFNHIIYFEYSFLTLDHKTFYFFVIVYFSVTHNKFKVIPKLIYLHKYIYMCVCMFKDLNDHLCWKLHLKGNCFCLILFLTPVLKLWLLNFHMPLQDGSEGILKKWQTSLHQRDIDVVIGSHGDQQPRGGNTIIDLFITVIPVCP